MRKIKIDTSRTRIVGHASPGAAIAAANEANRGVLDDSNLVRGQYVERVVVAHDRVLFYLSGDYGLEIDAHIAGSNVEVGWRTLTPGERFGMFERDDEPMLLQYTDELQSTWDPVSLIAEHAHAPLKRLFAGEFFLNVYFERSGALMFIPTWNATDDLPLLSCCELERFPNVRT